MQSTIHRSSPPLHKEIAEGLSERIISGDLPAKSLLPAERELCQSFGVSRTVVREAIKSLESRGLVRIERGRGTVVLEARPEAVVDSLRLMLRRNMHSIGQLLEVRRILEAGMAALAAQRRTEQSLTSMEHWLAIMRQKPGEPAGYVDADLAFHAEIAHAAQNPVFNALLDPFAELLRDSRIATFSGPRVVRARTRQHEAIMTAIRLRDPERASAAMSGHLADTVKDLERRQGPVVKAAR
jgi:GntR family transcriptional repressor for pyruvate dehydrogenase complex